jgi:serine phosphatase RsbU (regulator of sigma subunit)
MTVAGMLWTRVLRLAVVATSVALGVAWGQEPAPAQLGASVVDSGQGAEFTLAWRFHRGDDPRWADPDAADRAWRIVEPRLPAATLTPEGWTGVGWFRRHLEVAKALWGVPLTMRVAGVGSSEVFLDGKLVARFEPMSVGAALGVTAPPTIVFNGRTAHLLAVRYSLPDPSPLVARGLDLGFYLTLEEPAPVLAARGNAARRGLAFEDALTVIPLFLGILHLGLFGFYPKARENLFYALYMLAFAVIVYSAAGGLGLLSTAAAQELQDLSIIPAVAAILFGLFTYYALRTRPFPRTWVAFVILAPVPVAVGILNPGQVAGWCWVPYFGLTVVEIVRVEASGKTVAPEGGRLLFWGLLVIYGAIALQALINVGAIPAIEGSRQVYIVAILAAAVTMSLSLARSFAHTRIHLERRLDEVQALSAQVLEQERAAHARELQQSLLEAENARTSAELEAARALQLSMLPKGVPDVEGLDVAVAMSTASEVGGDYYDFRPEPDGSLVIAIGDATGHGVAAGTMVTAVKALFTAFGGGAGLAAKLVECDRVLRGMNVRPLHMCLTIARVRPRRLEVCLAAMPPVLVWRARTGVVEEIGSGGLPLGGKLAPKYEEHAVALEAGDTLLFTTDGFPELLDPTGIPLGFDRAAETLREAAGGAASHVVQRLKVKVAEWRGSRELADDVTFVVVRVG